MILLEFINANVKLSFLLFGIFCVLVLFFGIILGLIIENVKNKKNIKAIREDAVKRSRAVLGGQFGEQLAPYLPGFPCNPGDVRFVGKPIDYVAFPGSAKGEPIKEVLLIEVKSGQSTLSPREKEIQKAVERGAVRYVVYQLPD